MSQKLGEAMETGLSDDHFREIGRVAVLWSAMESSLQLAICAAAKVQEPYGAAFTAHLNGPQLIDVFKVILPAHLDDLLVQKKIRLEDRRVASKKELPEIIGRIHALRAQRNLVVHGRWIVEGEGAELTSEVSTTSARGKVSLKQRPMNISDIACLADEIAEAINDLQAMLGKYRAEWWRHFNQSMDRSLEVYKALEELSSPQINSNVGEERESGTD